MNRSASQNLVPMPAVRSLWGGAGGASSFALCEVPNEA